MIAIEVETRFWAAHALRQGEVKEALHRHEFGVVARLTCGALDEWQMVVDFAMVEGLLEEVVGGWRERNLNEVEPFVGRGNASAERIAEEIGVRLAGLVGLRAGEAVKGRGLKVAEVRVTEAAGCVAIWMNDERGTMMRMRDEG